MAAKPGRNEEKLRDKNGRISSKRSEAPLSRSPVQLPVQNRQSRLLSERMVFSITLHEGSLLISLSGGAPLEAGGLFIEAIAPSSPCLGKLRAGDQLAAIGTTSLLGMCNRDARVLLKQKLQEWGAGAVPLVVLRPLAGPHKAAIDKEDNHSISPENKEAIATKKVGKDGVQLAWQSRSPEKEVAPLSPAPAPPSQLFGETSFVSEIYHKPIPLNMQEGTTGAEAQPSCAPVAEGLPQAEPIKPPTEQDHQVGQAADATKSERINDLSEKLKQSSPRTSALLDEFEAVRSCVLGSFQRISDMQKREFFVVMLQSLVDTARNSLHGTAETVASRLISSPKHGLVQRRLTMPPRRAPSSLCKVYPPPASDIESSTPLRAPMPPKFMSPVNEAVAFQPHAAELGAMYASLLAMARADDTSIRVPVPSTDMSQSVNLTGAELKAYIDQLMMDASLCPTEAATEEHTEDRLAPSHEPLTEDKGCQTEYIAEPPVPKAPFVKQPIELSFCDEVLRKPRQAQSSAPVQSHINSTADGWKQFYAQQNQGSNPPCSARASTFETMMMPALSQGSFDAAVVSSSKNESTFLQDDRTPKATMARLQVYVGDQLGSLGVDIQGRTINRVDCGIFVLSLTERARKSGCLLKERDQIVEINGQCITGLANLTAQGILRAVVQSGKQVTLGVLRPIGGYAPPKTRPAPPTSRHMVPRDSGKPTPYRAPRPQTQLVVPFDINVFHDEDVIFSWSLRQQPHI